MSRVAILYNDVGGTNDSASLDVLIQCREVRQSLLRLGYEPTLIACTLDLASAQNELNREQPQCVFNLVESLGGTDRLMAAATLLLDAMQLPYTGAGTDAILLSGDKLRAKFAMVANGIPTPTWFDKATQTWLPVGGDIANDSQVIFKSIYEHASFGMGNDAVQPYRNVKAIQEMLADRRRGSGCEHLAEQFIAGREFNLSLLEIDGQAIVLAPAEIEFQELPAELPRIVGLRAKWHEDSIEYRMTPRRFDFPPEDARLIDELTELAIQCWRVFDLRGYARVDFRVDEAGRSYVLEVNANPCLSSDAGFVAAAQTSEIEYDQMIQAIVRDACRGESYSTQGFKPANPTFCES